MGQNLSRRRKFRNAPSACGGDRNFQGFASVTELSRLTRLENKDLKGNQF
jgi:hypothetical protein